MTTDTPFGTALRQALVRATGGGMISFAAPWALFGLAAALIPILLHLFARREPPTVEFPAVRYLSETARVHQRRLNLQHWLLLLARTLLIVLLVLAAAGPTTVARWRRHPRADRDGGGARQFALEWCHRGRRARARRPQARGARHPRPRHAGGPALARDHRRRRATPARAKSSSASPIRSRRRACGSTSARPSDSRATSSPARRSPARSWW